MVMYTRLQSARQQWGGSSTAIDSWLEERQQLIVSYCKLAALPPFDKQQQDNQLPAQDDILGFCQLLMDYLLLQKRSHCHAHHPALSRLYQLHLQRFHNNLLIGFLVAIFERDGV